MVDDPGAAQPAYPAEGLDLRGARLRIGLAAALSLIALAAWVIARLSPGPDDGALPLRGATDARTGQRATAPR